MMFLLRARGTVKRKREGDQAMRINRKSYLRPLFVLSVPLIAALLTLAPVGGQVTFNEREVRSQPSLNDPAGVYALDFRFKDPRLVKVNITGRGTRICWYLWYQVVNRTGEPRQFNPDFELVTLDYPAVYKDEVLPLAEEAIKRIEDPTGYQDIKNSLTISLKKIPPSKADAFPHMVTGVAIWDASPSDPKNRDPKTRDLSDATRFSIFVKGLSNGYVIVEPLAPGLKPVTRFKTLQLNFQRRGDRFSTDSRDITFVPPFEWIYRAATVKE